jgi:hypothetical protein
MAIDHAGQKARKAAENRLHELEGEFALLREGLNIKLRRNALIVHTIGRFLNA